MSPADWSRVGVSGGKEEEEEDKTFKRYSDYLSGGGEAPKTEIGATTCTIHTHMHTHTHTHTYIHYVCMYVCIHTYIIYIYI